MSSCEVRGRLSQGDGVFVWEIRDVRMSYEDVFRAQSPRFHYYGVEYAIALVKPKCTRIVGTSLFRPDDGLLPPCTCQFRLTFGDEGVATPTSVETTVRTRSHVRCDLDVDDYVFNRNNYSVRSPSLALSLRFDPGHAGRRFASRSVQTDVPDLSRHATERKSATRAVQTDVPDLSSRDATAVTKLQDDFKKLVLSEEDSDVSIKVQGKSFPAHKAILRARSPVLKAMFENDMREKLTGGVAIEDCDPKTFPDFLNYLYTGNTKHVGGGNVCQLYTVSDKYEVLDLKSHCTEFMKTHVSTETFCDFLALALKHQEGDLISVATEFFCGNAVEIVKSVKWQIFHQNNHTVADELFLKVLSRGKSV